MNFCEIEIFYESLIKEKIAIYRYKGHVCLIVNVASKCGLTATNYKELNELYDQYSESKGKVKIKIV